MSNSAQVSIFLGAVLGASRGSAWPALLFFDWDYHEIVPHVRNSVIAEN